MSDNLRTASSNRRAGELAERDERDTNLTAAVVRLPRRASGPLTDAEWDELFALRKKITYQGSDLFPA